MRKISLSALSALFLCSQLSVANGNVPDEWLHPQSTKEIRSCLSPDLEEEERSTCRFYAAIIDAGSTGTRLHLFEFSHDPTERHSKFILNNETFKELKPGLSAFAETPELAAESVKELLLTAQKNIPSALWHHTPVAVKATAGLRLLPDEQADAILSHVAVEVANSGFLVDEHAVGILSGVDEGVFAWFTLNFLTDRLQHIADNADQTAAALDLGGGSTQLSFVPAQSAKAFKDLNEADFSHKLNIFGKEIKLYTHSYLGNGLVAARLGIAQLSDASDIPRHKLVTDCFAKGYLLKDWDYAAHVWSVGSTDEANFANCLKSATNYVRKVTAVRAVEELSSKELYVFSYFYDRAVQAEIAPNSVGMVGGDAKVGDYKKAAEKVCAIPSDAIGPEHWQPWQCLDLTYIYALLHHGYGLPDEKTLHVTKKMRGMEVSWALGAAYHLLNTYHEDHLSRQRHASTNILQSSQKGNDTQMILHRVFLYLSDKASDVLSMFNLLS